MGSRFRVQRLQPINNAHQVKRLVKHGEIRALIKARFAVQIIADAVSSRTKVGRWASVFEVLVTQNYNNQITNIKWFDKLTTLSPVEGQIPMSQIQNSKQTICLQMYPMASSPSDPIT